MDKEKKSKRYLCINGGRFFTTLTLIFFFRFTPHTPYVLNALFYYQSKENLIKQRKDNNLFPQVKTEITTVYTFFQ